MWKKMKLTKCYYVAICAVFHSNIVSLLGNSWKHKERCKRKYSWYSADNAAETNSIGQKFYIGRDIFYVGRGSNINKKKQNAINFFCVIFYCVLFFLNIIHVFWGICTSVNLKKFVNL